MSQKIKFPIDFIISWVDQSDSVWKNKYNKYSCKSQDENAEVRYRDYGTLRYVFRSIEKYAPWVRKVFLVTDKQRPAWLNIDNPKLVLVDHADYIPQEYLPTFNSNVIELNYYRISGLADHFVVFNDDTLINKQVNPSDFFSPDGNPRDTLGMNAIMPYSIFDHTHVNNLMIINDLFPNKKKTIFNVWTKMFSPLNLEWNIFSFLLLPWPKFTRFFDPHTPISFKKSTYVRVLKNYPDILTKTGQQKFRSSNDFSIWLFRYVQMLSGNFSPRNAHFGVQYDLISWEKFINDVTKSKHSMLNINDASFDDNHEYEIAIRQVNKTLKDKFFEMSKFEIER